MSGQLNLAGSLKLAAAGGKVKAGEDAVLVEVGITGSKQGSGIPVIQPPPPAGPIDSGTDAKVTKSFNSSVTVKVSSTYLPVVALGVTCQGNTSIWPGMVLPSTKNAGVAINRVPVNVVGDTAITLPNGGTVQFDASGQ